MLTCKEDYRNLSTNEGIAVHIQNNGFYKTTHPTGTTGLMLIDVTISNESDSPR